MERLLPPISRSTESKNIKGSSQTIADSTFNSSWNEDSDISIAHVIRIVVMCVLYMFVGPILIIVNNAIMHEHAFPYPIILSAFGVCSSALVARFVVVMEWGTISPDNARQVSGAAFWSRLCPVGVLHALTLGAGNAVYLFLGIGFVQMLKAFTPVVILFVLYLFQVEFPSRNVAGAVVVISLGTMVTTASSPESNIVGLLLILASEVCEASRLVLTQHLLCNLSFSVLEGQYFLAPLSSVALVALACVFELPKALKAASESEARNPLEAVTAAPHLFLLAASLGVAVNYLGFLVIREVGSLTFKVLGTLRNIGLVLYGVMFMSEAVSGTESLGYLVSLAGFAAYTHFKTTEQQASSLAAPGKAVTSSTTTTDGGGNVLGPEQQKPLLSADASSDEEENRRSPRDARLSWESSEMESDSEGGGCLVE